jgi:hypothetical protein
MELEKKFYSLISITFDNPWPETNSGILGLPLLHYNLDTFFSGLKAGNEIFLVTGLCPLSTIANEIGFRLPDGSIVRPTMGFGPKPLLIEYDNIDKLIWPNRPILNDYIRLRNVFEIYRSIQNKSEVSVLIWYPSQEYFIDLTENIFFDYIDAGVLDKNQINHGLNEIRERYYKLFKYASSEKSHLVEIDEHVYSELEKYRLDIDLSFFNYIYGSWVGSESRRRLYENLVIKHIQPIFDGKNVLHLDTSYELWVDIIASIVVEKLNTNIENELIGNYSWLCCPSLPSINLNHMREYNAPHEDKLYLGESKSEFEKRVETLPKKYIEHVAPLFLDTARTEQNTKLTDEIINEFKTKLRALNDAIQD